FSLLATHHSLFALQCGAQAFARLPGLEPFEERHAGLADATRTDQAHALFAQAADVFRAPARLHVRDAVAVRAGEGVALARRPVGIDDAGVAAGVAHNCSPDGGASAPQSGILLPHFAALHAGYDHCSSYM